MSCKWIFTQAWLLQCKLFRFYKISSLLIALKWPECGLAFLSLLGVIIHSPQAAPLGSTVRAQPNVCSRSMNRSKNKPQCSLLKKRIEAKLTKRHMKGALNTLLFIIFTLKHRVQEQRQQDILYFRAINQLFPDKCYVWLNILVCKKHCLRRSI